MKVINYLKDPQKILISITESGLLNFLPDDLYLRVKYKIRMGKKLNLDNPKTYNEKSQWLKIHDRRDIYTRLVDKSEVKKVVADIIGKEYIIPTLGLYDSFDEINFDKLPNQLVIKCTHDSGGITVVKNKKDLDLEATKKKINKCLKCNYFYRNREWPYKGVKPRILIEKYMEDGNDTLRDYKMFCFNGEPKIMYVSNGSHTNNQRIAFFDMDFKQLDIKRTDYADYEKIPTRPKNWKKMKDLSGKLSEGIPHVRVDWYEIGGNLYFGEITFYTGSGMIPFVNQQWDKKLGDLINLKLAKNEIKKSSI